jgi:predicted unusual protein kinase regulating ubiquinone biosynthesis (AarF/ABC1/UbiB family)
MLQHNPDRAAAAAQVTTDWVGLVDEWALRFFAELDYESEARNAATFRAQMAQLPGITVAEVLPALSTREVLATEWVQGAHALLSLSGQGLSLWMSTSFRARACTH